MKKRKSIRFLIQFFFTLLLLVGAELLFACFGVQPEDGKSTLYQFYLSLLFALDLPCRIPPVDRGACRLRRYSLPEGVLLPDLSFAALRHGAAV